MDTKIILSVLIPSVHTRIGAFTQCAPQQLFKQFNELPEIDKRRVEIIALMDTKSIVLGDKRTELNWLAGGKYVVHVDDDDSVAPDFLKEILRATESDADLITFHVTAFINHTTPVTRVYSIKYYDNEIKGEKIHYVIPDDRMVIKRELAVKVPFPSVLCGEDVAWAKAMRPYLKTEHAINKALYYYHYNVNSTETQGRNKFIAHELRKLDFKRV